MNMSPYQLTLLFATEVTEHTEKNRFCLQAFSIIATLRASLHYALTSLLDMQKTLCAL